MTKNIGKYFSSNKILFLPGMKAINIILISVIFFALISLPTVELASADDGPYLVPKSSISSLKVGLRYLEHRSGNEILPSKIPMPLMDPEYFSFGDWAFYADEYLDNLLKPHLNGHARELDLKPLDLACSDKPEIIKKLGDTTALVRVEYPRHKELERLLQKLYFNLFRGPVILSVAYCPEETVDDYERFQNWHCFDGDTKMVNDVGYDVHTVYVDWSRIHTVVAFLDKGKIKVVDGGKVYVVDHNALVAQANAIRAFSQTEKIINHKNHLNYLICLEKSGNRARRK